MRLSWLAAASIAAVISTAGCGASGGGVTVGNYTGSGTTTMNLSGALVDSNGVALRGYSVVIDNHRSKQASDAAGNYEVDVPTIEIVQNNTIEVFDPKNALAHRETRAIDTAICVQTLQPIVVGPPGPP